MSKSTVAQSCKLLRQPYMHHCYLFAISLVSCQPAEDISVVSWNRQVQHILASANPSGKAVVWDLRKNEPIIKISDHSNRVCSGTQTPPIYGLECSGAPSSGILR